MGDMYLGDNSSGRRGRSKNSSKYGGGQPETGSEADYDSMHDPEMQWGKFGTKSN